MNYDYLKFLGLFIFFIGHSQTTIVLESQSDWYDTGLDLTINQEIRILTYGVHADNASNDNFIYGPGGSININNGNVPISGIQDNALIGKLGLTGNPFYIGSGGKYSADSDDRLYVKLNDGQLNNNEGALIIKLFSNPLKTSILDTSEDWTSTEFTILENTDYFLYATGSHADNPNNDNWVFSPSGSISINNGNGEIAGIPDNCLIGKIGLNGEPFYIGDGGNFSSSDSGVLYIKVNDGDLTNNIGFLILQIFDNDDTSLSVGDLENKKVHLIYPNPFEDELVVESLLKGDLNIMIYGIDGRLVIEMSISSGYDKINTSELSKGTYIVQISEGRNIVTSQKLIKK